MPASPSSPSCEAYAKEQAALWRRTAIVYIAAVALIMVGLVWGWLENAL